jgi:phosphonate dehydrogenase
MSSRPRIVVTHRLHAEAAQRLREVGTLVMNESLEPWSDAEIDEHLRDATAWIAFMTDHVGAYRLAQAPRLRVIAGALKGCDSFDAAACAEAGVWLTVVPDLLTAPTAELAIGLAIAAARHVRQGDARVRTGEFRGWRARDYGRSLSGSVCAVLGLGRLGSAIVDRLQGFGCEAVLGVDPVASHPLATSVALEAALAASDFVFLALPLNSATVSSIDAAAIAACTRAPVMVNVGRGSVVVESDVAAALRDGWLGGYAADVFAFEDWSLAGRPLQVAGDLLTAPNTLFTPHLGSAVHACRRAIEHAAVDNVLAVLSGARPPGAVNRVEEPSGG